MRIQTTITRLTQDQWETAQTILRAGYDIRPGATRVCLVLSHRGEERHAELPLGSYIGLLGALGMDSLTNGLRTAMAALTPDALPDTTPDTGPWAGI